jgi:hypothetical protein
MSDLVHNIRIDGTAFGAKQSAAARFKRTPLESLRLGNGGIIGAPPAPSYLHDSPSFGARRYNGPLAVVCNEDNPAAIEEWRQFVYEEEERRFVAGVHAVLQQIAGRRAGRAVIDEVGRRPHQVTITPYLPPDFDWTNGKTRPVDWNWTDATRKHWLLRNNRGEPVLDKDGGRSRGTGVGADAIIEFISPELMRALISDFAVQVPWSAGGESHTLAFADEILVHELVHAIRIMAGLSASRRVPLQSDYGNIEELFAIVIANIYRSECGRGGVRNDNHSGWDTMYVSGKYFLKMELNREHMRQFRRQHPQLADELREIDTYFNPFRHMRDPSPD